MSKKKTFKVACSWEVCGLVDIEADSVEEAITKAENNIDEIELPTESDYIDGSFKINDDSGMMNSINDILEGRD